MARRIVVGRALLAAAAILMAVPAWASSPRLSIILPRGIQRGTEQVVTFSGSSLGDAQEILFYSPGFEVTKLEPNGNTVKVTIKVATDCRPGEHVAQVRCASGISDYRTFFVDPFPAVAEKEPNSNFDAPQPITLGVTVGGVVQNEDVDYYVLDAKKGQRISAEVFGMRLGNTLFDPYVAILDSKRFELSSADDTPLVLQDSVASVVAPADGKYYIEVRESAYGGNGSSRYRLHVGTFPRPTAVYPAGGKLGEEVEVRFLGDPAGELKQKVKLPATTTPDFGLFATDAGGIPPSPNPFRLFEYGNAFEVEPNEAVATATPVQLPLAFNGIIEKKGDVDCFKFSAKKGQVFEVECYARRVRSALDPVMNLYYANGKSIAGNDDSRGPDSYFRFSVPADGEYVVRVTDHLGRGGSDFVYRIEFQAVKPRLTLGIPRVERYGQYRQTIYVARGNKFATLITASRANFGGELVLEGKDLPAGITMHAENMPSNLNSMPVVFEAAADAPLSGKLIDFTARHADPKQNIVGGFANSADFIRGAPGQSIYKRKAVNRLAIAVVEELPFTLEIIEPKVPIVRNGSMQLKIVVHRKEGFKGAINVQLPFRPPGLGAASSVNIPADKNEVLYPLSANGGAQIKKWRIYAIGSSNVKGAAWVSSQLATLEIAAPYVTFAVQRASCEQGEEAQIYCKLNHAAAFDGMATVKLLGLPPKVATTDIQFNKDTKELTFILKTEKDTKPGKYNNVFCQLIITQNGESIVSRAGGTQLQIDKPLPPPPGQPVVKATPKPMPKVAAGQPKPAPPKPPKPLTRLQKLRLAAKQRAEAKATARETQETGGGSK
jgi:hypothetical protein